MAKKLFGYVIDMSIFKLKEFVQEGMLKRLSKLQSAYNLNKPLHRVGLPGWRWPELSCLEMRQHTRQGLQWQSPGLCLDLYSIIVITRMLSNHVLLDSGAGVITDRSKSLIWFLVWALWQLSIVYSSLITVYRSFDQQPPAAWANQPEFCDCLNSQTVKFLHMQSCTWCHSVHAGSRLTLYGETPTLSYTTSLMINYANY